MEERETIWESVFGETKVEVENQDMHFVDSRGNDVKLIGLDEAELMALEILYYRGYNTHDITKRAPEIAPCPNPECGKPCHCEHESLYGEDDEYTVTCHSCGYYSPVANSEDRAIRLHNLIAGKGMPKWIKAELEGIKHNLSNAMWVDACGNMETIAENVLYDINRIIAGKGK